MKQVPATYNAVWQSLLDLRSEAEVLQLLQEQIERDFTRGGHPLSLPNASPTDWHTVLSSHLGSIPAHQLSSLLYLIDLPETLIRHFTSDSVGLSELAKAILYREIVKIYFKLNYSA